MYPDDFLQVWDEIKLQLRGRISLVTGRPDMVDDLLQDVFVNVYPKAAGLHESYAAKYVMRAATNAANSYLKSRWSAKVEYWVPERLSWETPLSSYLVREREEFYKDRILPTLERLPHKQRTAIEAYMEFSKRRAASRAMGIPLNTLKHRQKMGLKNLRKKLKAFREGL